MKIDLHVHARERSSCAKSGEEEMVRAAIQRGLDGLAFTDHGRLIPPRRVAGLNARYAPFRVFGGIEIRLAGEDVLVLGLEEPLLERRKWTYPELHAFVRQHGGFLVLAHPFRYHDTVNLDVEGYPPDAIELRSVNIRADDEGRIRALAQRLDLRLLCNSDAHRAEDVGCHYNLLPRAPQDDEDLARVLRDSAGSNRADNAPTGLDKLPGTVYNTNIAGRASCLSLKTFRHSCVASVEKSISTQKS
jgi:histidinol phosphatase-like PHP family hydrolase